jgi:hypothetical protein
MNRCLPTVLPEILSVFGKATFGDLSSMGIWKTAVLAFIQKQNSNYLVRIYSSTW